MEMERRTFPGRDGEEISYQIWWDPEATEHTAMLQIVHGYAEWTDRYDAFARLLADEGFVVFGEDHRGHGHTRKTEQPVIHFADEDGFETVVDDIHLLTQLMRESFPDLPLFMMGHSLGSFLGRRYIEEYGQALDGIILEGTGNYSMPKMLMAAKLAMGHIKKYGADAPDPMVEKIVFGSMNKGYPNSETGLDWLSSDKELVRAYYESPMRGQTATGAFFRDFLLGMVTLQTREEIDRIPKGLPVLFLSGEKDPVGGKRASGVRKACRDMRSLGMTDVQLKIYSGARHELINETESIRRVVAADILRWMRNRMAK